VSADRFVVAVKPLLGAVGVERRGRIVRGLLGPTNQVMPGRSRVSELKSTGKPFDISKREVWEAYQKVKANQGAPGVDGCSIEEFEKDLKGNLYKIWNRMSSGSYFPPPVKAVEIPKPHGGGTRILGVPTVADRVAQTVVAAHLEKRVDRFSTRTPTATDRSARRWTRSRRAGGAAGPRAGPSILTSPSSSTACRGISSSKRWRCTPTRHGWCCM